MRHQGVWSILLALFLLVGCGGGGGGGSSGKNASLDGIWEGTVDEEGWQYYLLALIYDNTLYAISGAGSMIYGKVHPRGNNFSGQIDVYNGYFIGENSISGSVRERQRLEGSTGNGSTFNLAYNTYFDHPSSLGLVEGIWSSFLDYSDITTITIQADGTFDGSDSSGCHYSGRISAPDTSKNIYRVQLTISNCGMFDGQINGHATLIPTDAGDDVLFVGFGNNEMILMDLLQKQS